MAQTLNDIELTNAAWVDINVASGIAVGTSMYLVNKGTPWVRLYEGTTPPSVSSKDGILMTGLDGNYAEATIGAGALTIWAISTRKASTRISVSEV